MIYRHFLLGGMLNTPHALNRVKGFCKGIGICLRTLYLPVSFFHKGVTRLFENFHLLTSFITAKIYEDPSSLFLEFGGKMKQFIILAIFIAILTILEDHN